MSSLSVSFILFSIIIQFIEKHTSVEACLQWGRSAPPAVLPRRMRRHNNEVASPRGKGPRDKGGRGRGKGAVLSAEIMGQKHKGSAIGWRLYYSTQQVSSGTISPHRAARVVHYVHALSVYRIIIIMRSIICYM